MGTPVFKLPERKDLWTPTAQPQNQDSWGETSEERSSLNLISAEVIEDGDSIWLLSYSDLMTLLFGFFVMLMSFSRLDVESFEGVRKQTTELFGGEYKKPHEDLKEQIKNEMRTSGNADKALFDELEKGIALTFRGSVFFNPGSAEITPEALALLEKVIPIIKNQQKKFNVVVEGHTDDSPIQTTQFPSNWELSSQRASAVLRLFEKNGFNRSHLRAIGFADTLPVSPNRNIQGQVDVESQNLNRRVVIKLIRSSAQ